jgi:hypothetical protein
LTEHLKPVTPVKEKAEQQYSEDAYYAIEPLYNFDVDKEPPAKLRPFKPKFHMTMGTDAPHPSSSSPTKSSPALENTTLSDLIPMDSTYRERLKLRTKLLEEERHEILACNPIAIPAVLELYEWLTRTYLPQRFPTLFALSDCKTNLLNKVTGTLLPLNLPLITEGAETALQILGSNIDDEFLFLLKSEKPEDEGKYRMEAFLNCFPSGFNTRSKLNMLLADIHDPVPSYKTKLEKSMDRFFASLPIGKYSSHFYSFQPVSASRSTGKIVKRANWSISTNGELFCLAGNHMTEDELATKEEEEEKEDIDLRKTVLRCERQTLHRLPQTGALVFAFKTYMYPIQELRDEGSGEVLAGAIDGLGLGSVPGMTVYKRQVVWGEKVKEFLRGEIGVDG